MCLQCRRPGFNPWVRKIPWRREKLPTPVFWPGEFHGPYSPWGHKKSDTTERHSLSRVKGSEGRDTGSFLSVPGIHSYTVYHCVHQPRNSMNPVLWEGSWRFHHIGTMDKIISPLATELNQSSALLASLEVRAGDVRVAKVPSFASWLGLPVDQSPCQAIYGPTKSLFIKIKASPGLPWWLMVKNLLLMHGTTKPRNRNY